MKGPLGQSWGCRSHSMEFCHMDGEETEAAGKDSLFRKLGSERRERGKCIKA